MTPERHRQIGDIYHAALEVDAKERSAFLDRACAGDILLRREVESLIESHEQGADFIAAPALAVAAELLAGSEAAELIGRTIAHYKILSLIGAGGMGKVYLAEDTGLGRRVALKLLPEHFTNNQNQVQRFRQEARAASALNHPNILTVHEVGQVDGTEFIATEFVEGETLRLRLTRAPLGVREVLDVAVQVAEALVAAHQAGIVHRDIKPENVMIRRDGYVKVLDFGLAKLMENLSGSQPANFDAPTIPVIRTNPGLVMGTPEYMSPEQARGLATDARTDVWSLGVVVYEMLACVRPFGGASHGDIIVSILEREPVPLLRHAPGAPAELERIVTKALAKDTEERYQTVKDMAIDLRRLRRRLEIDAEIKRSAQPSSASDGAPDTISGGQREAAETYLQGAGRMSAAVEPRQTSSVEYIVSGVKRHRMAASIALLILACTAAAIAYLSPALYRRSGSGQPPLQRTLSRLTSDPGLQSSSTFSPDGRLIAFSSNRTGNFDVWVQSVSGGDPVQVTKSPAHEWQPNWSPDGSQIAFRSERDEGGIFVIPALGGTERKLAPFGYLPRWSPDGSKVLFQESMFYRIPKLYIVPLTGGPPREILADTLAKMGEIVDHISDIVWHPDGDRVSIFGYEATTGEGRFWTVPVEGGTRVESEIAEDVKKRLKEARVSFGNFLWSPNGDALYLEGFSKQVGNIWRISVEPKTLSWTAGPERLTTGAGRDTDIALSPDGKQLAFTVLAENSSIWSLPFDPHSGKVTGEARALTPAGKETHDFDLRGDEQLVYSASRVGIGKYELWEMSLRDGRETLLLSDDYPRIVPRLSPDGSKVSYTYAGWADPDRRTDPRRTRTESAIAILRTGNSGGDEQPLTSPPPKMEYAYDWSPDGQWLLGVSVRNTPGRTSIYLFPVFAAPHAETGLRELVSDPAYGFWQPSFSPDGRWICLTAVKSGVSVVGVAPASGGKWEPIIEAAYWADKPRWSPDGKTLYFISNQGTAFFDVWGVRFDPALGKSIGEPFRVTSLSNPGKMISWNVNHTEIALSETRLLLPLVERAGSIWMLTAYPDDRAR